MKATLNGKLRNPNAIGGYDSYWSLTVPAKRKPMRHHDLGLSWTASGYGKAMPSDLMVFFNGRWRRVYICCYSNAGTAYVKTSDSEVITLDDTLED